MSPVGHARGSTTEGRRALDRKLDTFRVSRTTSDHPKLATCIDCLRCGDVLIALDLDLDLDRLARLAGGVSIYIDEFSERRIGFRGLISPMNIATPTSRTFVPELTQIRTATSSADASCLPECLRPSCSQSGPSTRGSNLEPSAHIVLSCRPADKPHSANETVTVHYRFHPLAGTQVTAVEHRSHRGEPIVAVCDTHGKRYHLPLWMTAPEAAQWGLRGRPRVSLTALSELRDLIAAWSAHPVSPEAFEQLIEASDFPDWSMHSAWRVAQGQAVEHDLTPVWFPAWMLLEETGLASVLGTCSAGDEPSRAFNLVIALLSHRGLDERGIELRRSLQAIHPGLLERFLAKQARASAARPFIG